VVFSDESINATEWSWDFNNDGLWTAQIKIQLIYDHPGTLTIKLNATDLEEWMKKLNSYITVNKSPNQICWLQK
jgi:PKD repeat protein